MCIVYNCGVWLISEDNVACCDGCSGTQASALCSAGVDLTAAAGRCFQHLVGACWHVHKSTDGEVRLPSDVLKKLLASANRDEHKAAKRNVVRPDCFSNVMCRCKAGAR